MISQQNDNVLSISAMNGDVKPIGDNESLTEAVKRAAKGSILAVELPHKILNEWDLWYFPRPRLWPRGWGQDLCATPVVHKVLAARYRGIAVLGTPAATGAKTLLTTALDEAACDWLRSGKNVLLLQLTGPAPGVKLGWWGMSKQAGTAIAEHPAFGDFPHQGYLNELWFRILNTTVRAGLPAIKSVEPLMVGNGGLGYLIHVFQAKAGKGKLLASGLDLLTDKPEAAYLLDQFIRYVGSDRFQPAGTLDLDKAAADWETWTALASSVSGWSRTTKTFKRVPEASYWGERPMSVARLSGIEKQVAWLTRARAHKLQPHEHLHLPLAGGPGLPQPAAGQVHAHAGRAAVGGFRRGGSYHHLDERGQDGSVAVHLSGRQRPRQLGRDGIDCACPAVTPGQPAELRVVPTQNGSMRWFGLFEWPQ